MPRPIWSGSLNFGLVNVPVRLMSAVRDLDLHFRQLHAKDDTPVETRRVVLRGGRRGPLRGHRQRVRRTSIAHRRGAQRRRPEEDQDDRDRGLRQARGDRPDLLRPPVLPRPRGRDRRHRPRLPPAGRGDGPHRPRRARALRPAHEGVPGRDPRPRAGADALDDALPRRGPPDRRHPGRRRAHEEGRGRARGEDDRGDDRRLGPDRLRGRVPQAAAGDRAQEAQGRRDQGAQGRTSRPPRRSRT